MRDELSHTVRAELHYQRGKLSELCGDIDTYREAMLQAKQHIDQTDDEQLQGLITYELAQLSIRADDAATAAKYAASIVSDSAPPLVQAGAYRVQARAQLAEGNCDQARLLLQRAIALADQVGDPIAKAMDISLLGEVEGQAHNLEAARTAFDEAVALFEANGDQHSAAITYHQWAKALYLNGLMEEAGERFIHAASIFAEFGDQATLATVAHNFQYYLGELGAAFASYMALKWLTAGLPGAEVRDYVAKGLDPDLAHKPDPET